MSSLLGEARVRIRPDLTGFLHDATRGVDRAGQEMGSTFSKAARRGAFALAGITAAAGLAAKSTLDIGIKYQNSLNTLQAVSGATARQMSSVSDTAKKLGQDMTLPATSAADAASAMTELAKAGFSVSDAQKAAKGSLQLAAAAQIDAAQAATIQANAINAFGLKATDATKVADILANTANASSAEIGDVALALQQAGAVAHAAGVPITDAASAIGLLANNGIKGSDAGTLLKSALLALESPSKPAKKAMQALSLSAYDAHGNFVGLESIFRQLADAQKRMTPQAYAAATSTLFGSDAARLAGVAGKEGAAGFDKMRSSMSKQGAAADVAAAKSKGVGGAIEALKSQVETFQIDLFQKAAPNIEKLVRYAATNFPKVGDALIAGGDRAIQFLGVLKDDGIAAFKAIRDYLAPLTTALGKFWESFTAHNGTASALFGLLKVGAGILLALATALHPIVSLLGEALTLFSKLPGPIQAVVLGFAALKTASNFNLFGKLFGGSGSGASKATPEAAGKSLSKLGSSVRGFADTVRLHMRLAGDEVSTVNRVTGSLSAGFQSSMPRVSSAVGNFTATLKSATQQARALQNYKVAQIFGADSAATASLSRATGDVAALGAAAKVTAKAGIGALKSAGSGLVGFLGGPWGVALAAGSVALDSYMQDAQNAAQVTDSMTQAFINGGAAAAKYRAQAASAGGVSLGDKISKAILPDSLLPDRVMGQGTKSALDAAGGMNDAQKAAERYFKSLNPVAEAQARAAKWQNELDYRLKEFGAGSPQVIQAQQKYAYWTGQAADRATNLANAAKSTAQAIHDNASAALSAASADVAAQSAKAGLTIAVGDYKKSLHDANLTGAEHQQQSAQMTSTAMDAAQALAAQALAHSTAATAEGKQSEADAALLSSLRDTAKALGKDTPKAILDLIASLSKGMSRANEVASAMTNLGLTVEGIPNDKSVIIDAPTAAVEKRLEALGYKVKHLPNGQVEITANVKSALNDLAGLYKFIDQHRTAIIHSRVVNDGTSGTGGKSLRRASGGPVFGAGTSTSDSIPALLSNGEYVVRAKSVAKYGLGFLHSVNAGRYASGGLVSSSRRSGAASIQSAPLIGGDVTFVVDPSRKSAREQLGDVMFDLKRIRRGGRVS